MGKKTFRIEQYEIWTQEVIVEAETKAEAIQLLLNRNGTPVDNTLELVGRLDLYGMTKAQCRDELGEEFIEDALNHGVAQVFGGDEVFLPSIRSIEEE